MRKTFVSALAAAVIALTAFVFIQHKKGLELTARLEDTRTELERKTQRLQDLESGQDRAEQARSQLIDQVDSMAERMKEAQKAALAAAARTNVSPIGKAEKGPGGLGNVLSSMMSDPEMKKVIRDQQRAMLNLMYGPLFKQLALPPDDTERLKDLLVNNQMNSVEQASSLFGEGATNRDEALATLQQANKNAEEQIKAFLGDARYAQYQDYQQTAAERVQLNQFRQQLPDGTTPLTDQQTEQLLALMKEQKQNAAAVAGQAPSGLGSDSAGLQAMMSDDQMEKALQRQAVASQQVYSQAAGLLSPDQLNAFGIFQTNQLQMMRAGMGMARKFFAPASGPQ
jgi:hypothetical protein